jgi:hypothetical protein
MDVGYRAEMTELMTRCPLKACAAAIRGVGQMVNLNKVGLFTPDSYGGIGEARFTQFLGFQGTRGGFLGDDAVSSFDALVCSFICCDLAGFEEIF